MLAAEHALISASLYMRVLTETPVWLEMNIQMGIPYSEGLGLNK